MMEIRQALKEQYRAGLKMLNQCVEICPDELWIDRNLVTTAHGSWGGVERSFWRIAFHDAYFTHLYLGQEEESFQRPTEISVGKREDLEKMWQLSDALEPYDLPPDCAPCSQSEISEYIQQISELVGPIVDGLDLDSAESGFSWYKGVSKLSHELMNLRHLQGHVGQLSELLMQRGIDTRWIGR